MAMLMVMAVATIAATIVRASLPSQRRTKAAAESASGHQCISGPRGGSAATVLAAGGLGRGLLRQQAWSRPFSRRPYVAPETVAEFIIFELNIR